MKLNKRLSDALLPYATFTGKRTIIFPSGSRDEIVYYSDELKMWWHFSDVRKERYWNCFGVDNPNDAKKINITCEINMPFRGVNLRTAGMWAENVEGKYIILHNGSIRGGQKGVGKSLFRTHYKGEWAKVKIDKKQYTYAPVAQLDDDKLPYQIRQFVRGVREIKDLAKSMRKGGFRDGKYNPEFSGTKRYDLPDEVVANCNHGIVVDSLQRAIEALGYRANNTTIIDLYTQAKGGIVNRIFEVKTALSRQTVYTAIGQLKLNSIPHKHSKLYFVSPNTINKELINDLQNLGIMTILYVWKDKLPEFINLKELI